MPAATMKHGTISGPLIGGLSAIILSILGNPLGICPVWVPMLIAALGVTAAFAIGRHSGASTRNIIFRCSCWVGAALWTIGTIIWGWSVVSSAVFASALVLAGVFGSIFADETVPERTLADAEVADEEVQLDPEALALRNAIVRTCSLQPKDRPVVTLKRRWNGGTGETWEVEFPAGSPLGWRSVAQHQTGIAAALRLPVGCPVNSEPAPTHQGAALLQVSRINDMDVDEDYPNDYSPRSLKNEFVLGRFLDRSPTLAELYQAAGLITGQRGSGKTVVLQVITANLMRCRDVVIWHVDLNGGGMSSAWTMPFALGQVHTPGVDWVATTPEEALLMAEVATKIAKDRKRAHQRLMLDKNVDVLPIDASLPAIIIIVDEGGEITGEEATPAARQAANALRELQRIGRAMMVNVLFSVQRATADYFPAQMKKATSLVVCMQVKDAAELAYAFDWDQGLSNDDLIHVGMGFIQRKGGPVKMFKGFRLMPQQMVEIVHATQHIRPPLDARSLAVAGPVYLERWDRPDTRKFLEGLRGEDIEPGTVLTAPAPDRSEGPSMDDLLSMVAPASSSPDGGAQSRVEMDQATVDQAFEALVGSGGELEPSPLTSLPAVTETPAPVPPPPASKKKARHAFIVAKLDEAGAAGLKRQTIIQLAQAAELIGNRPQVISEDLNTLRAAGLVGERPDEFGTWVVARYAAKESGTA